MGHQNLHHINPFTAVEATKISATETHPANYNTENRCDIVLENNDYYNFLALPCTCLYHVHVLILLNILFSCTLTDEQKM